MCVCLGRGYNQCLGHRTFKTDTPFMNAPKIRSIEMQRCKASLEWWKLPSTTSRSSKPLRKLICWGPDSLLLTDRPAACVKFSWSKICRWCAITLEHLLVAWIPVAVYSIIALPIGLVVYYKVFFIRLHSKTSLLVCIQHDESPESLLDYVWFQNSRLADRTIVIEFVTYNLGLLKHFRLRMFVYV